MKKNILKKVTISLLLTVLISFIVFSQIRISNAATDFSSVNVSSVMNGAKDQSGATASVQNVVGAIMTMARVVGTGVAVIMLIVLAIKYISAAPGDKADIKKHAVVYVVGAVVLFGASGIIGIIQNFALSNIK